MAKNYNILFVICFLILLSSCSYIKNIKAPETKNQISTEISLEPIEEIHQQISQELEKKQPETSSTISLNSKNNTEKILPRIPETPQIPLEEILSSYRLGKGDLISIKVFGEEDFSMEAHLNKEGSLSYPILGELRLAGLTVGEVEQKIVSGLKGDYLVNPKVTVTVLEYRQLFVNGEVKNPGGYPFEPGMTINKALSLGGGFTENASREEIFIIRDGENSELAARLDTYVSPGDIILVKEYKEFFIKGAVKSAGSYAFIPNLTVEKAISIAGGFSEFGSVNWSRIYIIRDETSNSVRIELNTPVNPGDMITVKESAF